MINYEPLWKTMEEKGISTYRLIQKGIDSKTIYLLKRNANITLLTAEKLCNILDCQIGQIVRFDKDESKDGNGNGNDDTGNDKDLH